MRVVIALGANLGDRLATLRAATTRIAEHASILGRSHVWETAPVGGPEQPRFFNAAILVEWGGTPFELLDRLLAIEAELGRERGVPNGPRTIDLDILWIAGQVVDEPPRLVVPHPRVHLRAFALAPMLEVAPNAVDPHTGQPYVVPSETAEDAVRRLEHVL